MNDLSWLIYLADVAGTAKAAAGTAALVCVAASGFGGLVWRLQATFWKIELKYADTCGIDPEKRPADWLLHWTKPLLIAAAIFAVVAVIFPARETVYAIAASEMGEELIKTPTFNKASAALDAWLDRQIAKPVAQ